MLPISGAQHVQAFCKLFQGFTARAVPRQCFAMAVCPTKAVLWGLGTVVLQTFSLAHGWTTVILVG